jgi:hypothetical protein
MTGSLAMLDRVSPTSERPTTQAERDLYDLNRRAAKLWHPTLHNLIVDLGGRPNADLRRLGDPTFDASNGRRVGDPWPKIVGLRGPSIFDQGSWTCLGPPHGSGETVVSLVAWLGGCDETKAAAYLKALVDRIVEIAA